MREALTRLIRAVLPAKAINRMYDHWLDMRFWILKRRIIRFLECDSSKVPAEDRGAIIDWLKKRKLTMMPYGFVHKHLPAHIQVYIDGDNGMKYVLFEGKRLYFRRGQTEESVQRAFATLLNEQHEGSPHRYVDLECDVAYGDVVVDAGASEGIFALSVIERASKIYLVECNKDWIEALLLTFAPYREKIEIVPKFISDNSDGVDITTLDEMLGEATANFIKADIEGAEVDMLRGGEKTLKRNANIKLSLCTYHNEHDAEELRRFLEERGLKTRFSDHFMIMHYDPDMRSSWLRHGVIRAVKQM